MMGCGKSSVGRELSRLLSLPFVDLDDYIEEREGRSIRDIFERVKIPPKQTIRKPKK